MLQATLYEMEAQRLKYLLISYHRSRLFKVRCSPRSLLQRARSFLPGRRPCAACAALGSGRVEGGPSWRARTHAKPGACAPAHPRTCAPAPAHRRLRTAAVLRQARQLSYAAHSPMRRGACSYKSTPRSSACRRIKWRVSSACIPAPRRVSTRTLGVKPRGTRLGIMRGGKGAVRLPKLLVLASGLLLEDRTLNAPRSLIARTVKLSAGVLGGQHPSRDDTGTPWPCACGRAHAGRAHAAVRMPRAVRMRPERTAAASSEPRGAAPTRRAACCWLA